MRLSCEEVEQVDEEDVLSVKSLYHGTCLGQLPSKDFTNVTHVGCNTRMV